MVFLSYFVFPFKNKTKISGNSKKFSKIIFSKKKKKKVMPSNGNACAEMRGPHIFFLLLLFW